MHLCQVFINRRTLKDLKKCAHALIQLTTYGAMESRHLRAVTKKRRRKLSRNSSTPNHRRRSHSTKIWLNGPENNSERAGMKLIIRLQFLCQNNSYQNNVTPKT